MKTLMIIAISIVSVGTIISSCNRYMDNADGKTVIDQGSLQSYPDSNLFIYKTNVIATRDTEKIYPKFFEVTLPKKMKYYEFVGSSNFGFYYSKGQTIFIKIELEPKNKIEDMTYTPSNKELEEIIQSDFKTDGRKYDIKTIPIYDGRKNTVLRRGDATILLYNINSDNYEQFFSFVSRFKFIN